MSITGLSLSKITNISSSLMTVLLALNLHSLADRIGHHAANSSSPVIENGKDPSRSSENGAHILEAARESRSTINKMLGWTPVKGLAGDAQSEEEEEKEDAHNSLSRTVGEDAVQSDPRVTSAEQELMKDIAARKGGHAQGTDQQEKDLEKERADLDKQIQALSQSAEQLSAREETKRKAAEVEMNRLARVYEQMPPRDAAAVFNILDMRVMVPVAQRMIPRKVSAIIGGMLPDRANILSQYLAGMRKLNPEMVH